MAGQRSELSEFNGQHPLVFMEEDCERLRKKMIGKSRLAGFDEGGG